VLLALVAGTEPPPWARTGLVELAATMEDTTRRERAIERAVIDGAEAVLLASRQGEVFEATVIAVDPKRDRSTIQLADPAVIAPLDGIADVGVPLTVRLVEVDPVRRTVRFAPADPAG
jgi:exoribonuclease R